jgi:uroporphyrinogen III methyltransferase/synthase
MTEELNLKKISESSGSLKGRTVLVTRTRQQAEEFAHALDQAGATVAYFPTIEIVPPDSWIECDRAIRNLHDYNLSVFTSVNAVENFFSRALVVDGWSLSTIRRNKIYAVGEKTKGALESHGCRVEDLPWKATAEELGHLLGRMEMRGKRVLLPRGNLGTQLLPKLLRQYGAIVDEVVVYQTRKPESPDVESVQRMLDNKEIDAVTFFSPSSVRNFVDLISSDKLNGVVVAVIGEVTTHAAQRAGLNVDIVAAKASSESMVSSLADFFAMQTATGAP